jgi:hypothetical protein
MGSKQKISMKSTNAQAISSLPAALTDPRRNSITRDESSGQAGGLPKLDPIRSHHAQRL